MTAAIFVLKGCMIAVVDALDQYMRVVSAFQVWLR